MVSGRIYVTNDQIVCGAYSGSGAVLYPQNRYVHPTEKQCNYTYTHPTTKQCNWTPDGVINWVLRDTKTITDTVDLLKEPNAQDKITDIGFQYSEDDDFDLCKVVINSWSTETSGRTDSGFKTYCTYGVYNMYGSYTTGQYSPIGTVLLTFQSETISDPTVYQHSGSNVSFVFPKILGRSLNYRIYALRETKAKLTLNASLYYAKL